MTDPLSERWKKLFADAQPKSILGEFPHPEWGDEIAALEARLSKMEEALGQIVEWSKAYPLGVFPEPDFKKAAELLKAGGMTLDAISASNMRHVVVGVGKIAKKAIASQEEDLGKLTTQQKPTEEAMEEARSPIEP